MSDSIHEFSNGIRVYRRHVAAFNQLRDHYEPETHELFESLLSVVPDDGCFVNIGSSIGFYTLLAKRQRPRLRVHAYEPLDTHREFFAENVRLNGMCLSDFVLYEEGVAGKDGFVEFFHNNFGSTIIQKRRATASQQLKQMRLKIRRLLQQIGVKDFRLEFTRIPVVSLETVIARAGETIDLLQMDIQGSEGDVLTGGRDGLRAGKIKALLVSTHGPTMHDFCVDVLSDCGFQIKHEDRQPKCDGNLVAVHASALANKSRANDQTRGARSVA